MQHLRMRAGAGACGEHDPSTAAQPSSSSDYVDHQDSTGTHTEMSDTEHRGPTNHPASELNMDALPAAASVDPKELHGGLLVDAVPAGAIPEHSMPSVLSLQSNVRAEVRVLRVGCLDSDHKAAMIHICECAG